MSKQRLIDGNDLFGIVSLLYDSARRTSRECEYFVGQILFDIKQQPTIEVVPVVHGRWVTNSDNTHYCYRCGKDATYNYDGIEICGCCCAYCGARMDGGT